MSPDPSTDLASLRIPREAGEKKKRAPRRRRGRWMPGLGPLLVLAVIGGTGFVFWPRIEALLGDVRAPEVEIGIVTRTRPNASLEITHASGYVVARVKAALAPRYAGRLVALLADVGDRVEAEQVVARIEPSTWRYARDRLSAALLQARAEAAATRVRVAIEETKVARADADLVEARAAIRETEADLAEAERVRKLEQRLLDEGSGLADDLDKAVNAVRRLTAVRDRVTARVATLEAQKRSALAEVRGAEARIPGADAAITAAAAELASAEVDLGDTEIRAPFAGMILRKEAEVGEIVVPALAGGSTSRGAIVTMAQFSSLEMELDVFERDIREIEEGGPASIALDAYPGVTFPGKVRQVVPTADRTKGTVQVKVSFDSIDSRVMPEMAGRTVFFREKPETDLPPEVLCPTRALTRLGEDDGVYALDGNRVQFRPVVIGERRGTKAVITRGLDGGEGVVLDPSSALHDNMVVKKKADNE